jgi:hypothetical protein
MLLIFALGRVGKCKRELTKLACFFYQAVARYVVMHSPGQTWKEWILVLSVVRHRKLKAAVSL